MFDCKTTDETQRKRQRLAQNKAEISPMPLDSKQGVAEGEGNNTHLPPQAAKLIQTQQTFGNRYTQSLIQNSSNPPTVQARLKIGPVNDKYEQEAGWVAKQVSQNLSSANPVSIHRKPITPINQSIPTQGVAVSPDVEAGIEQACGGGRPFPSTERESWEKTFDADFGNVSIHTDQQANQLNHRLRARAFTVNNDIFFRRGSYDPDSTAGKQLLAHELTHILQQGSSGNAAVIQPLKIDFYNGELADLNIAEFILGYWPKLTDGHDLFPTVIKSLLDLLRFSEAEQKSDQEKFEWEKANQLLNYLLKIIPSFEEFTPKVKSVFIEDVLKQLTTAQQSPEQCLEIVERLISISPQMIDLAYRANQIKLFEKNRLRTLMKTKKLPDNHFPIRRLKREANPMPFFSSQKNLVKLATPQDYELANNKLKNSMPYSLLKPARLKNIEEKNKFKVLRWLPLILQETKILKREDTNQLLFYDLEDLQNEGRVVTNIGLSQWKNMPAQFKIEGLTQEDKAYKQLVEKLEKANWFIRFLVDNEILSTMVQPKIIVHQEKIREHAKSEPQKGVFEIHINPESNIFTIVHELGHIMERQLPSGSEAMILSFLKARSLANTAQSNSGNVDFPIKILRIDEEGVEIGFSGSYPSDHRGTGDYASKYYADDTEVTSTTLEYLFQNFEKLSSSDFDRLLLIFKLFAPSLWEDE